MTPAAGDFTAWTDFQGDLFLDCPKCGRSVKVEWPMTVRSIVAAASEHARTTHAMSDTAARTGA